MVHDAVKNEKSTCESIIQGYYGGGGSYKNGLDAQTDQWSELEREDYRILILYWYGTGMEQSLERVLSTFYLQNLKICTLAPCKLWIFSCTPKILSNSAVIVILGEGGYNVSPHKSITTRGGGSSIIKVPGDAPPTRVYFFGLLVWPRVYFLAILVELSLGKGMLFGNFGQRDVKIR